MQIKIIGLSSDDLLCEKISAVFYVNWTYI